MILTLIQFFVPFLVMASHAFHVSVCEVYYNNDTKSLEIAMKIFIDDMDLAIQTQGHEDFTLLEASTQNEELLKAYIIDRYNIYVDGKNMLLNWVGFELKNDALQCYLEGKDISKISEITFDSRILTDIFDDQINLIHFQYNDGMKSLKATGTNSRQSIDASKW